MTAPEATPAAAPAAAAPAPKPAEAAAAKGDAQAQVDQEQEQGYRGVKVDPLPNEYHTFPGPSKEDHAAHSVKGDAGVA